GPLLPRKGGGRARVAGGFDVAEQSRGACVVDCALQYLDLGQVLAADVDEDGPRLDRVRSDQAALDEKMRIAEHDLAVLERAGLRLVCVDDEVRRFGAAAVDEAR